MITGFVLSVLGGMALAGALRERSKPKEIEFVCHMPDGTENLAGAARRPK